MLRGAKAVSGMAKLLYMRTGGKFYLVLEREKDQDGNQTKRSFWDGGRVHRTLVKRPMRKISAVRHLQNRNVLNVQLIEVWSWDCRFPSSVKFLLLDTIFYFKTTLGGNRAGTMCPGLC